MPDSLGDRRRALRARRLRRGVVGWLLVVPAGVAYAVFVLSPMGRTIQYSLYDWNGITESTWVGLDNYLAIARNSDLYGPLLNAFQLIIYFSFVPVAIGLFTANAIRGFATSRLALVARTVLFLPQIIPLVAAGVMWGWVFAS
ncbi:MAG TPA: sugar ABC transporter permease, partial [Actinotalea sp.]|nr:sugar ABC transporter permease [Actinotalea sp.]